MKKYFALLLVLIVVMGVFPVQVFAWPPDVPAWVTPPGPSWQPTEADVPTLQTPVGPLSNPRMTNVRSTPGSNSYTFNLSWLRPPLSGVVDGRHNFPVARERMYPRYTPTMINWMPWALFPVGYEIYFRNATTPEVWNASVPRYTHAHSDQTRTGNPPVFANNITRTFLPSSLYQIQILPVKVNPQRFRDEHTPPGMWNMRQIRATLDTSVIQQRDIVFLSDIEIYQGGTYGRGNSITVEWYNPTFNGMNVFDEWLISFALHNPADPHALIPPAPGAAIGAGVNAVRVPFSEIEVVPGGRLRHTITHVNIVPTQLYNVRVEPMLRGQMVRDQGDNPTIQMPDGITYNFAHSPLGVQYRTVGPILIAPQLNIEMIGADFARLWWSRLDGVGATVGIRIFLEEWCVSRYGMADPFESLAYLELIWAVIDGHAAISETELLLGPNFPRQIRAFALMIEITEGQGPNRVVTTTRTNLVIYDPTYVPFSPYRPDILGVDAVTIGVPATSGVLQNLRFLAFARATFNLAEEELARTAWPHSELNPPPHLPEDTLRFIDHNVYYEIFVADTWETLGLMHTPLLTVTPTDGLNIDFIQVAMDGTTPVLDPVWYLQQPITEFYTFTEGVGLERRLIQGNRVYYIRIRAVRDPGGQRSQWAYASVFMPPFDGVPAIPEMIYAPPVQVVRERERSIEIEWPLRFLEIMQELPRYLYNNRDLWHSMIGVTPSDRLIFGRSATHIENALAYYNYAPIVPQPFATLNEILYNHSAFQHNRLLGIGPLPLDLQNPRAVSEFLVGPNAPARIAIDEFIASVTISPPALRIQDMTYKSYEIHVVEYNHLMSWGTLNLTLHPDYPNVSPFEAYRDLFLRLPVNAGAWTSIEPDVENGMASFAVTNVNAPVTGLLQPNTAYVIFIRTYEMTVEGLKVSYIPNFVIGNTVTDVYRPIHDPTTPVLHPVHELVSDQSVGVRWRVQDDTGFRLMISERMAEHPNQGTLLLPPLLTRADIEAALADEDIPFWIEPVTVGGVDVPYFFLRIDGLFPDTTYYVWAFAYGLNPAGEVATPPSQASNPVDMRTLDISPPRPPAIAPAPTVLLDVYNRLNDTSYSGNEPHALNILLTRIFADYEMGEDRAESGTADGGSARTINLPQDVYRRLYIIRFEELIANERYYIRARTVLTVQRSAEGLSAPSTRTYHYEIQVANNPDFLDAITFTIPTAPVVDLTGNLARRAYSPWVEIELDTGYYDGEFDGVHRPEQHPLPERDWEITYDPLTQTLQWRFRTNRTGADDRPDQNVDQRFISRLISERTFVYTIDISEFHNLPITNRVVEIPVSIIRAFDERLITLEINTGDMVYSFAPGTFDTAQVRAMQQSPHGFFRINMNKNPQGLPALLVNTSHAIPPQRLSVTAHTMTNTVTMNTFARPVGVNLSLENFIAPGIGANAGLYQSGAGIVGWQDMRGQFSFADNTLRSQTSRPGTFAGISRNAPPVDGRITPGGQDALNRVSSRLTITDMFAFNPAAEVTANQLNNFVNAISRGNSSVTMNANLPANATRSLTNARLLAPNNLTREAAIDILVRLYEQRTRQILTPMSTAQSIPGLQNATPALHRNLRIAADIGFITGPLVPQGRLTMGELMHMLDIIIVDAGM